MSAFSCKVKILAAFCFLEKVGEAVVVGDVKLVPVIEALNIVLVREMFPVFWGIWGSTKTMFRVIFCSFLTAADTR